MVKKLLISLICTFFAMSTVTHAASLKTEFTTLVKQENLRTSEQSACIESAGKKVFSHNENKRSIPASVSKLYTFDFALATLPEDFRYTTTAVLNKNTLYINGGGDPHFVIEHLAQIVNKIYAEKKVRISTIVFTPDFYFNWETAPSEVSLALTKALKAQPLLPVTSTVRIVVASSPYRGTGTKYEFRSAPLLALLKQMNNYSTNISTDVLFAKLGGSAAFGEYMKKTYGVDASTIHFETGSGLSGNYTTCGLTLRVIKHLDQTLQKKGLAVTDVLSIPRVDPGVIKNRAINMNGKNAIAAKSGFVNYHHSLAGVINTNTAPVYFAIFMDYDYMAQTGSVKSMVDVFAEKILDSYKNLKSYTYTPDPTIFENVTLQRL